MAKWKPQKQDVLEALAAEILHNYGEGRAIIAVDGLDGAGTAGFADALAAVLAVGRRDVFRASIDDFHRPRVERYARGKDSPEGFYRDSFNYLTFRRILIEPFRIGRIGSFVLKAFDLRRDAAYEPVWSSAGDDALLIVDGVFLNRPELRGIWNYSIWLEAGTKVAAARVVEQYGENGLGRRYAKGQALYLKEAKPREVASAIIENSDLEHPRRVFADAC